MAKNTNSLLVAMVLNEHQVVLNAGRVDGVHTGYSYVIYEDGPNIKDPSTGQDLGNLELVKGRVWVHQVADAHCVAGDNPDEKRTLAATNNRIKALQIMGDPSGLANVRVGDRAKRVS